MTKYSEYSKILLSKDWGSFSANEYLQHHYMRFEYSLEYISQYINPDKYSILDLGERRQFVHMMNMVYPNVIVDNTNELDLRYDFMTTVENKYDMILCMEVIEHVMDRNTNDGIESATYTANGIKSMIKNCCRLLKPNGRLFISTPNVCSTYALYNIINYRHPYFYPPHTRELSYKDIESILIEQKFSIENVKYIDALVILNEEKHRRMLKVFEEFGVEKNRENSIFIIAKK